MKKRNLLISFFVFLLCLTIVELFYFFKLKKKIVPQLHKLTKEELAEIKRVKRLSEKGKEDFEARQLIIAAEATKTADFKAFSQLQYCYLLSEKEITPGLVYGDIRNGLLYREYEGVLDKVEEFNKKGCSFFKLTLSYAEPFYLFFPSDLFLETKQGKVNASFLNNYLGRRVRLALEYKQQDDGFVIKNWKFVRFYVE